MIFSKDALLKRRQNVQQQWDSLLANDEAVLIECGNPIQKPGGLDQTYPFHPHPIYFWLTGIQRAGGAVFYSKNTGWMDFVNPVSLAEKIWENAEEVETSFASHDIDKLDSSLQKEKIQKLTRLGQIANPNADTERMFLIKEKIDQVRRRKDSEEVELVKKAAHIANFGYQKLKQFIRAGVSEREIQIEFEAEVQRRGGHGMPYESIVGSGRNAATLHAIPTLKIVEKPDLVLIDAGTHLYDYCVDITRVFPASGKFSSQQQALYDLVLKTHQSCLQKMRPGEFWRNIHLESARIIAEGLKDFGIAKVSSTDFIESGALAVFYPHGVGHLVGLRVRDVGHEENRQPKKYAGAALRVDLQLEEDFMLTVEPGCYFIPAYLQNDEIRKKYADQINWPEVEKWKDIGGVRLEDDIVVRANGPENLTEFIEK